MSKSASAHPSQLRQAIDVALQVGQERAHLLEEVRTALEAGDDQTAIVLMRRYCDLPPAKAVK
jgi:hypothetical protein